MRNYLNNDLLKFTDITFSLLKDYEQYLRMQGLSINTVAYYMRNLRSLYNCAVKQCVFVLPVNGSPFGIYKIQSSATAKRALTTAQLRAIATTDFHDSPMLELARDVFMASFYLRGIPFVDLVHLTQDNIRNGHICYSRRKTAAFLTVEIIPALQKLIDKYASSGAYLFPFLEPSEGKESVYKQYRNGLIGYNRCLKQVGERAGLNVPLTGYVARHTWATAAKGIAAGDESGFQAGLTPGLTLQLSEHLSAQANMGFLGYSQDYFNEGGGRGFGFGLGTWDLRFGLYYTF